MVVAFRKLAHYFSDEASQEIGGSAGGTTDEAHYDFDDDEAAEIFHHEWFYYCWTCDSGTATWRKPRTRTTTGQCGDQCRKLPRTEILGLLSTRDADQDFF